MPLVRVSLVAGRSQAQKQKAAEAITQVLVDELGSHAEHVYVIFDEVGAEDWLVGGVTVAERQRQRGER